MQAFSKLLTILMLTGVCFGQAAAQGPAVELIWTGTSGSGSTGTNVITATPGDLLTMDIVVQGDALGILSAALSLGWDAGDLTAFNPVECPSPPYAAVNFCFDPAASVFFQPLFFGAAISADGAGIFDAASFSLLPGFFSSNMILGRIQLLVESTATLETVKVEYDPFLSGITDGASQVYFPIATAQILPPGC